MKKIIATTVNIILYPFRLLIYILSFPGRAIKRWFLKQYSQGKSIAKKTNKLAGMRVANLKNEIYIIRKKI